MALISVREHGRIHIGTFDPWIPSVTAAQADCATGLKSLYGFDVFRHVNSRAIAAQQYVGAFQLGPHTVEVLPKVSGTDARVRHNLVMMLAVSLKLDIAEGDIASLAQQNQGILEILIRIFCDKLFVQIHRGLVRRYESRVENLTVLRGRLMVTDQIRRNAASPEHLFCHYDEFQEDNALNVVLKAAIRLLVNVARSLENQRRLLELLLAFDGVSDCPISALPWQRISFDRLSDRYAACVALARLFLKNAPPDVSGGRAQAFSLFFDMNALFEAYIGQMAMRVFAPRGINIRLQGPRKHLAFDERQQRPAFLMKPDICAVGTHRVEWIIDTKWKELSVAETKEGVAQSDLYQMHAYASCYDCADVVLLYPHHGTLGPTAGERASYVLNSSTEGADKDGARRLRVATIDLSNLKTVGEQLEGIVCQQDGAPDLHP